MSSFATQFQSGAQPMLEAVFGETVTYARPSTSKSVSLAARFNLDRNEVSVKASALILNSLVVEPARGDTVTDSAGRAYWYPGPETVEVQGVQVVVASQYVANSAEWRIPVRFQT